MLSTETVASRAARRISLNGSALTVRDIAGIGAGRIEVRASRDATTMRRMAESAALVDRAVDEGWPVYGVTTGFGGMADIPVPPEQAAASQGNLLNFLAAGAGDPIDPRHVRGAMALRANVLMQGYSGVRFELIERLLTLLDADAVPVVRELGSIGASGDLVPLSVIARAATGQSGYVRVRYRGEELGGQELLGELGLEPLPLRPKEGLALVNGTSFSSAVAANCVAETEQLTALALAAQAMMLVSLEVQREAFEPFVHQRKPHPGQVRCAEIMRGLLESPAYRSNGHSGKPHGSGQTQDRYSLRCLPQYFGPLLEGLHNARRVVETEMNGVSDNPLVDTDTERFYQSGNFLGQYVGIAMDDLRRYLGLMAKHLDVQVSVLVTPEFNKGLPSSLRGNESLPYNMGLKGLQITGNSIVPMLTHMSNPLVEHFPTHAEQFNQNINGLAWGSAHLAWKSVDLFRHYMGVALLFSIQSVDLRAKAKLGNYDGRQLLSEALCSVYQAVCDVVGVEPNADKPLLYDDGDLWLEEKLARLNNNLADRGGVLSAAAPICELLEQDLAASG
ncbi:MAG: aromatic amino acid ammonia-lyase [Planctomycetota bacterium]